MTNTSIFSRAKWSFTTRRVRRRDACGLSAALDMARSGDVVLAEVHTIGQHRKLQLAEGRFAELYPGDLVVLACGNRYAPDQFEAVAALGETADMVAGGGIVGRMRQRHEAMQPPTTVRPLGLVTGHDGTPLNVAGYGVAPRPRPTGLPVFGVVGASMNSGKTTTTAALAHGLARAGFSVAALKATGTGAFGDFNAFRDAGAAVVADFTDVGMASTYLQPLEAIVQGLDTLLGLADEAGATVAVVELADGVFQKETAAILGAPHVATAFGGFLLATTDALSAVGGVTALSRFGIRPIALSGLVSRSPLAAAEAMAETGIEVLSRSALLDPDTAASLFGRLRPAASAEAA